MQSKLVRLHCSSCGDIIELDTSLQSFTLFSFHKINSSRHNNIKAFEIRYYMLIHNKDDFEFVTEFPCFLEHPVFIRILILNPSCEKNWIKIELFSIR